MSSGAWPKALCLKPAEPELHSDGEMGRVATLEDVLGLIFHGRAPLSPKALSESARALASRGGLDAEGSFGEEFHTPMSMAAAQGRLDWIEALRAAGASLDAPQGEGYSPLRLAIVNMSPSAALRLIDLGARIDRRAPDSGDPSKERLGLLAHASAMGFSAVASALLERGADPCALGPGANPEETPLMAACHGINSGNGAEGFSDYAGVVRALLGAGARLSEPAGRAELERCSYCLGDEAEFVEVAALLVKAGADPLALCDDGRTFAQRASQCGQFELAEGFEALAAQAEAGLIALAASEPKAPRSNGAKRV